MFNPRIWKCQATSYIITVTIKLPYAFIVKNFLLASFTKATNAQV